MTHLRGVGVEGEEDVHGLLEVAPHEEVEGVQRPDRLSQVVLERPSHALTTLVHKSNTALKNMKGTVSFGAGLS